MSDPIREAHREGIINMTRLLQTVIVMSVFSVLTVLAQSASVITENANLRGTPTEYGKVVDTISQGTSLEIVKQRGAWFLVQTADYVGWMHGNTIRIDSKTTVRQGSAVVPTYTPTPVYSAPVRRSSSASRDYIRGRRGGCYYINSNGNKTYVDRSLCN